MEIIPTQKIINRDGVKAVKNGQKGNQYSHIPNLKKPDWLRVKAQFNPNFHKIKDQVAEKKLNTVCEEAHCPNISECWSAGTATFMLMGSVCTRACKFCSVDTGNPKGWLDYDEPLNTAKAVEIIKLKYGKKNIKTILNWLHLIDYQILFQFVGHRLDIQGYLRCLMYMNLLLDQRKHGL